MVGFAAALIAVVVLPTASLDVVVLVIPSWPHNSCCAVLETDETDDSAHVPDIPAGFYLARLVGLTHRKICSKGHRRTVRTTSW